MTPVSVRVGSPVAAACALVIAMGSLVGVFVAHARAADAATDGRIVFASARGTEGLEIYTMRPDDEDKDLKPLGLGINPKWSRRGGRIAFVRAGDVYVMNADGSGVKNLTKNSGDSKNPSWSPDEMKIVFASNRKPHVGNYEIYVMYVDGSVPPRRLTTGSAEDRYPAWSPDGGRIAFQSNEQIYVMNVDGTGRKKLTKAGSNGSPAWSPDGTRIAFASNREPHRGNSEIYSMSAAGKSQTRLTTDERDKPYSDTDPAWSPDGTDIVFTSRRTGNWDLHVVSEAGESAGESVKRLTNDDLEDTTSDWWPDPVSSFKMLESRVSSGVMKITATGTCDGDMQGTGFLVGTRFIATASHVVHGAENIVLSGGSGQPLKATIHGIHPGVDLALLRSSKPLDGYLFSFAARPPSQDDEVAILGYPERSDRIVRRRGTVEEVSRVLLRVAPGVAGGNSGGPVVRGPSAPNGEAGDVVGLAFERDPDTDETRVLPAKIVRSLVQRWQASKPAKLGC